MGNQNTIAYYAGKMAAVIENSGRSMDRPSRVPEDSSLGTDYNTVMVPKSLAEDNPIWSWP